MPQAFRPKRRAGPIAAPVSGADPHAGGTTTSPGDGIVGGCGTASLHEVLATGTDVPVTEEIAVRSVGDEPGRAVTLARCALTRRHRRAVAAEADRMGSGPRRTARHGGHSHHSGSAAASRVGSPSKIWRQRPHWRGRAPCGSCPASTTPTECTVGSLRRSGPRPLAAVRSRSNTHRTAECHN
jgi:hypothetical protein